MNHYFEFECLECGDSWVNPPSLPTKCKECGSEDMKLVETTAWDLSQGVMPLISDPTLAAPLENETVKFEVDPSKVFERTTDSRGRISLPTKEFKNKKLKIVVVEENQ